MFNRVIPLKIFQFCVLGVFASYLTGCGISHRTVAPHEERPEVETEGRPEAPSVMSVSSPEISESSVEQQLHSAYREWQGTPYLFGGEGMSGIDCSALTKIVFRDFFNTELPRNTRSQLQVGSAVRRRSIRTGDLIFFKTGRKLLHVGISMGDGDFLHASISSGVMISNIGEPYWATRYLGARRVL